MRRQRGVGVITALVVLVMMAALAAAIVSLTATQSHSAAQDIRSAQAWQSARAGNEWGFYQALHGGACNDTFDLGNGFKVTVSCTLYTYNEGQSGPPPFTTNTVDVYQITAIACPAAAATCPDNAAAVTPGYVERKRVIIVTE